MNNTNFELEIIKDIQPQGRKWLSKSGGGGQVVIQVVMGGQLPPCPPFTYAPEPNRYNTSKKI